MARLPRYPQDAKATGADLNLILAILDTGGVIDISSATNSGVGGDGLVPNIPNVSGSISSSPGGVGAPSVPRGFTAISGIDNFSQSHTAFVLLSWTPNIVTDFVQRYDVYYHKGSDPTLYNLTVGGDVNSARVNNLFPGNTYSFAIQAHDAANRSSVWSPELNVVISQDVDPPAVPANLAATGTGEGVYLTWTEVGADGISNDLKQYSIAVSQDGGATYPNFYTVGPGNSYFYIPTTANQGTVFFKIATVDWTGNVSNFSSAVSAAVGQILGAVTINPGPLTIVGDYATIGDNLVLKSLTAATKGGYISFSDAGTSKWELGKEASNALQLYDNARGAYAMLFNSNGIINVTPVTTFANAVNITSGDATLSAGNVVVAANGKLQSNGGDLYLEANSANSIVFRPTRASTTNQTIMGGTGSWVFSGALSGITTLAIGGTLTGVTSLTMGGALSGVTTLAMSGALSGATTGTFSSTLQGSTLVATATGSVIASHFSASGSSPTISAINGGITGTPSVAGNDTHGVVTFVVGGSNIAAQTSLFRVNFISAYGLQPAVCVTFMDGNAFGGLGFGTSGVNTGGFNVVNGDIIGASTTYHFAYIVMGS